MTFYNFYERSITIYFLLMNKKKCIIESSFLLCFLMSGKLLISIAVAGQQVDDDFFKFPVLANFLLA